MIIQVQMSGFKDLLREKPSSVFMSSGFKWVASKSCSTRNLFPCSSYEWLPRLAQWETFFPVHVVRVQM